METKQKSPTKVYLACPYSHPTCKEWEQVRFNLVNIAAMTLINAGYVVFSPISHSHSLADTQPAQRNSHALWLDQDVHFMEWADKCIVLTLPGWLDSRGVRWEIEWFEKTLKPVDYVSMETIYYLQKEQSRAQADHA
jgi:nucleoside 2-deoxyribosyltransferase